MRQTPWLPAASAACCALSSIAGLGAAPENRPVASRPAGNVEAEIARLSSAVLTDPVDATIQGQLLELRSREERQRRDALNGLIEALQAHLRGQAGRTAPGLIRAMRSPYVVRLADHVLASVHLSLDALLIQAKPGAVCDACGGTMLADCPRCRGAGVVRCSACGGKGLVHRPAANDPGSRRGRARRDAPAAPASRERCEACGQTGVRSCNSCRGTGTVPCADCSKTGGPTGGERPANATPVRQALRQLIALSAHLRDGGLDLYSPGALRCSPRLPP